jgi:hypothetical protein
METKFRLATGLAVGLLLAVISPAVSDSTILSFFFRILLGLGAGAAVYAMTSKRPLVRRITGWALIAPFCAVFLHYTLPQHDIVQVVGTENRRIDFGENSWFWASRDSGTAESVNRDVFFIQARLADGDTMVYRNEDTGWDWPPYFKFDSSNLQADAAAAVSSYENPRYFSITHYGWRVKWLTIFPNAIALKPVPGPDTFIFPWMNMILLVTFGIILLGIRTVYRRFHRRFIKPKLDEARDYAEDGMESFGAASDAVSGQAQKSWLSLSRWIDTWKGKPRT